jgi:hypothetical protein
LQDESLANLEFRTLIKLENVLANKKIEEQNRKHRLESLYKEKEAILNEKVLTRKWKYEDDERKILSQYKLDINTKQSALEADLSQNR